MIEWTAADDAYLIAHRETPLRTLQRTLKRTTQAIRHRRATLGLTRGRAWSDDEITRLLDGQPVTRTARAQQQMMLRIERCER